MKESNSQYGFLNLQSDSLLLKRLSVQIAHFLFKLFHWPCGFDIGGDIGNG